MIEQCHFEKSWIGRCSALAEADGGMCAEHAKLTCSSCDAPATHDCSETGQFVCGAPLCDDCEHTIVENGTNGGVGFNASRPPEGMKSHCRKSEQRFKPWYMREDAFTAGQRDP